MSLGGQTCGKGINNACFLSFAIPAPRKLNNDKLQFEQTQIYGERARYY